MELLCDSIHGIYLPSVWARNTENIWGINQEDWDFISNIDNIEHDHYWDVWCDILDNAVYTDDHNTTWYLCQDGDLFAVTEGELGDENN